MKGEARRRTGTMSSTVFSPSSALLVSPKVGLREGLRQKGEALQREEEGLRKR